MLNDIERRFVAFEVDVGELFSKLPVLKVLGEGGDGSRLPTGSFILAGGGDPLFLAGGSSMYSIAADISGPSTNSDVLRRGLLSAGTGTGTGSFWTFA